MTVDGDLDSRFNNSLSLLKRAADVIEFGIRSVHFIPVEDGVFEYGVSSDNKLSDVTLDATLELEASVAGAAYAIYWTVSHDNRRVMVGGDYTTTPYAEELRKRGITSTFCEASGWYTGMYGFDTSSAVAMCLRNRKPVYIPDVATYEGPFFRRE